jgi:hypothetical protein
LNLVGGSYTLDAPIRPHKEALMQSTVVPAFSSRGIKWQRVLVRARVVMAIGFTTVILPGCGGAGATAVTDRVVDTSTLVGTWNGSLDGGESPNSYGPSAFTMTLKADSTFIGKAENPKYCDLTNTTWRVSGANFTASGRDCDGVVVTFAAPVSPLRLTGTWTASSGRTGGFTLAKQ